MIKKFSIENFRCFSDFTIGPLGRINLIVGENNVGKTALLEALWIYHGYQNPEASVIVNRLRGIEEKDFNIGSEMKFSATLLNDKKDSFSIDSLESDTLINKRHEQITRIGQGILLTPYSPEGMKVVIQRLSKLNVKKQKEKILPILKLFDPRIKDISIEQTGDIVTIYIDIGLFQKMPLSFVGEGFSNILHIILAIAENYGGLVLIDEIENSLHYTILPKLWESLAMLTEEYDVQICATTHSLECVLAAQEFFVKNDKYSFGFHRLENINEVISTVTYNQKTLRESLEAGFEVR